MKRKQSKHNQIKTHLKSGRKITGIGALPLYGLYNLNTVIFRLTKEGMKIKTTLIHKTGSIFGQYNQMPL